jgi:lysophospholipid acyltransferase (LPLAT)-like uncharacterized protein
MADRYRTYNEPVTQTGIHTPTAPPAYTTTQRFLLAVAPPLAALLLRLLCATLRFEERLEPGARPADRDPNEPGVYLFWHRCLLLAAFRYRNLGIRILISASFDGELIARLVERLGFVPIRGSSSRGGAAGLLALTRARIANHKTAITVDGPRGPVYIAKEGAATAAQRANSTAACFYLHPQRAWTLNSWDKFLIPKPFSRVIITWQAPIQNPTTDDIQQSLNKAVTTAERP